MPAFSTLVIAAAFALSANAAALDKRAVSAPVQLCIDGINFVAAQLAVVKADVLRVRPSFHHVSRHPAISKRVALLISSRQVRLKTFFLQQSEMSPRPSLAVDSSTTLKPFCLRILCPPPSTGASGSPSSSRRRGRVPLNSIRYFKMITYIDPPPPTTACNLQPHQWRLL
ncbi:hypothetical protein PS15p_208291 [Mucor circinelloides]